VPDPFPMSLADDIINEVAGHDFYSFTNVFSRYNQLPIGKEYQEKATFFSEFRSFAYKFMPFGLKMFQQSSLGYC